MIELQRSFQPDQTYPAIVVYERQSGITAADQAKAAQDARAFADVDGVTGQVSGPVPSHRRQGAADRRAHRPR